MSEGTMEVVEVREAVDATEIRRLLAGEGNEPITEMRVSQLVKMGLPKRARGEYDPLDAMHWYIGHLRRNARVRGKELAE